MVEVLASWWVSLSQRYYNSGMVSTDRILFKNSVLPTAFEDFEPLFVGTGVIGISDVFPSTNTSNIYQRFFPLTLSFQSLIVITVTTALGLNSVRVLAKPSWQERRHWSLFKNIAIAIMMICAKEDGLASPRLTSPSSSKTCKGSPESPKSAQLHTLVHLSKWSSVPLLH